MTSNVLLAVGVLVIWSMCITVWLVIFNSGCMNEVTLAATGRLRPAGIDNFTTQPPVSKKPTLPTTVSTPDILRNKLLYYSSRVLQQGGSAAENCTLVFLACRLTGVNELFSLVNHFCIVNIDIAVFQKIIIMWNDVNEPIPTFLKKRIINRCGGSDVKFVRAHSNFLSWQEIETDCE